MKKILILILFLLGIVLLFIYYSNKKIEGLYLKHYEINEYKRDNQYYNIQQSILDIENQKFKSYYYAGDFFEIEESNYFSLGNTIRIIVDNNDDFMNYNLKINKLEKDSLTFLTSYNSMPVYRKIPDSLKDYSKISLLNKTLELKSGNLTDTIHFTEKYMFTKNFRKNTWYQCGWNILELKGFKFLYTGDGYLLLIKKKEGKLEFLTYNERGKLKKINTSEINLDLKQIENILKKGVR